VVLNQHRAWPGRKTKTKSNAIYNTIFTYAMPCVDFRYSYREAYLIKEDIDISCMSFFKSLVINPIFRHAIKKLLPFVLSNINYAEKT